MIVAAAIAAGCARPPATHAPAPDSAATPAGEAAGDRLPDLGMARLDDLSIQETGGRRLLRYSTAIVNIGSGIFELRGRRATKDDAEMEVVQRVSDGAGAWREIATAARMVFGGDGHDHWHVRDLEQSELYRIGADSGRVGNGVKRGFCFWDTRRYLLLANTPRRPVFREAGCGDDRSLGVHMGLSVGWGDVYSASLPDQYVDISNLPDGAYRLVVTADPLNWFVESNENNNVTWVDFQISSGSRQVRVIGYGPRA